MIGWMQQRAYLKSLKSEAREVKFQAVRFRPEAEAMLQSVLQNPRIVDAEIVELPNGQFQVVAQQQESRKQEVDETDRAPFTPPFSIQGHEERGEAQIDLTDATGKSVWFISSPDLEQEIEDGFIDLTGRGRPPGAFASMIDTVVQRGVLDIDTADEALFEGPKNVNFSGGLRNAAV